MLSFRPRLTAVLLAASVAALPAFSADPPRDTTAREKRAARFRPAPPAGPHIAIFLPTESESLGALADSLRGGFAAAIEAAGKDALPVHFIDQSHDLVSSTECERSREAGAVLIVAGLTRAGAASLAAGPCARRNAMSLNDPGAGPLPPMLVALSLSAEAEARQAAALALAEGAQSLAVITGPSALAGRLADAVERTWARTGGEATRIAFAGSADDAPALRERLAKLGATAVFLALDSEAARAARPYISGALPVYATSHSINARADPAVNVDLEGVRYVDMPWFVQPDHPAVMAYPAPSTTLPPEQERLYALGIDAYRVGLVVARGEPGEFVIDGVTGALRVGRDRRVERTLVPARMDAGRSVPIRSPR